MTTIRVAKRFNGPPDSGNGGYASGLIASAAPWDVVEVTLRRPVPLDTDMSLVPGDDGLVLYAGPLIAEARAADAGVDVVPPVPLAAARRASEAYPGFVEHVFGTCYVCGPQRTEGDGLRIFPGPVGDGRHAAPWRVPAGVSPAMVWAALDCPGGWVVLGSGRTYLLGRMTAELTRLPAEGDTCVVVSSGGPASARTALVHSTLYGGDGARLATARATWVAI